MSMADFTCAGFDLFPDWSLLKPMPIRLDPSLTPKKLLTRIHRLFDLSAEKLLSLERSWDPAQGTPVFTTRGRYTSRTWTEWTQGFQFGSSLLQFDATDEPKFLKIGRAGTVRHMATHVSHMGVHDHGFNNVSTYGNLLRLMREDRIPQNDRERDFYELALKVSGAVQAARWTHLPEGGGYIYSFNGPHSLFIDTMRSLRSLALAHRLGHVLMGEHDQKIGLLERLIQHASTTARYAIYYGEGRDAYDICGRVAQESLFNPNDGLYRCPSTQQGYSPYTTWTRGLGWSLLGFAEELEFFQELPKPELHQAAVAAGIRQGRQGCLEQFEKAALAAADFAVANACTDGIPLWDTGAPNVAHLGDYLNRPSDPFNEWEPVDSSAAGIIAQGLIRLGNYLLSKKKSQGTRYRLAGLQIASTLFQEPYLSTDAKHQGLVLHSIYHRPNRWDYLPPGRKIPSGESSLWGDYHARELALLLLREAEGKPSLRFNGSVARVQNSDYDSD
jgi:unsaturated chondroitin disaccharide hydrolase